MTTRENLTASRRATKVSRKVPTVATARMIP
jgi:hypothetical protein